MKPASFSTISTYNTHNELVGLLLSLSLHHPNEIVYCLVDSKTKESLDDMTPKVRLDVRVDVSLDKYIGMNREQMEEKGLWSDFQMNKAQVISWALSECEDTYFLDADIILLDTIDYVDKTKDIGVSPQLCNKEILDLTGMYNGGTLWVKNKGVAKDWIEFTKTSRFCDQASIEDLVKKYTHQLFDESVNFGWWRLLLADNPKQVKRKITINNDKICYNRKPIKYIHTHFYRKYFIEFNTIFLAKLMILKKYKELLIIGRVIKNKWIIQIPNQLQRYLRINIWSHKNDSFRELSVLFKKNNKDVDIELTNSGHCWLSPQVLLYDRPTSLWFNEDVLRSYKVLLGNGDLNIEGKLLKNYSINARHKRQTILKKIKDLINNYKVIIKLLVINSNSKKSDGMPRLRRPTTLIKLKILLNNKKYFPKAISACYNFPKAISACYNIVRKLKINRNVDVSPWIFWPRRPMILEKILDEKSILSYEDRKIESIFVGNYENSKQAQYRKTDMKWESVLTEYHCTNGSKHKFTQEEYLMKLRSARYGLCLRGFGSKCHREVELMAFGTVPIVTPEVSISSYYDPPVENKHYLLVRDTDELKSKISVITKKKWQSMSKECYEWYQRNIYSKNAWKNMISNLLYNVNYWEY